MIPGIQYCVIRYAFGKKYKYGRSRPLCYISHISQHHSFIKHSKLVSIEYLAVKLANMKFFTAIAFFVAVAMAVPAPAAEPAAAPAPVGKY